MKNWILQITLTVNIYTSFFLIFSWKLHTSHAYIYVCVCVFVSILQTITLQGNQVVTTINIVKQGVRHEYFTCTTIFYLRMGRRWGGQFATNIQRCVFCTKSIIYRTIGKCAWTHWRQLDLKSFCVTRCYLIVYYNQTSQLQHIQLMNI